MISALLQRVEGVCLYVQ